ncbi:hypothetical protein MHU86_8860 [Fragilaria crotonensis]|nr:hypothetical protein MHU86_8860 [Fragilaria crotonensis]
MTTNTVARLCFVLLLWANIAAGISTDHIHNVWKLFSWSHHDVNKAMKDTALERRLDDGMLLMKDLRRQLQSGLPNEDVRTNIALNLEGI